MMPAAKEAVEQIEQAVLGAPRRLRFDATPELAVNAFDQVGAAQGFPLVGGKRIEGEQLVAGLGQALGHGGAALRPAPMHALVRALGAARGSAHPRGGAAATPRGPAGAARPAARSPISTGLPR